MINKEEKLNIVNRIWEGLPVRCPCCNTLLNCYKNPFLGGWLLSISCPRCEFHFEWTNTEDKEAREITRGK